MKVHMQAIPQDVRIAPIAPFRRPRGQSAPEIDAQMVAGFSHQSGQLPKKGKNPMASVPAALVKAKRTSRSTQFTTLPVPTYTKNTSALFSAGSSVGCHWSPGAISSLSVYTSSPAASASGEATILRFNSAAASVSDPEWLKNSGIRFHPGCNVKFKTQIFEAFWRSEHETQTAVS